jgi:hypothetical protein
VNGVLEVMSMNQFELHRMVEFIRMQSEFPFDARDIEEALDDVIRFYGFLPPRDAVSRGQLVKDLLPVALSAELGEIAHQMEATI